MNVNELFSKVAGYVKSLSIASSIVEAVLGLIVGASLGAILDQSPYSWLLWRLLIVLGLLYLILLLIRLDEQTTFPAGAIEELKSRYELEKAKKSIARKKTIDGYMDTVIKSLNQNTCSLSQEDMDELCDQDIEDGLRSVVGPIVDLPQYIVDCSSSAFTVGAFLTYLRIIPIEQKSGVEKTTNIFVLRDDLGLSPFFSRDLMCDEDATGSKFDLQKALQWTFNHNKFFENTFSYNGNDYTMVTSPVPDVCESDWPTGVLFIVTAKLDSLPEDLEGILLIFSRVLANWLSKYDDCNRKKVQATWISQPQEADVQSEITDD